jgi:hypothetical protein
VLLRVVAAGVLTSVVFADATERQTFTFDLPAGRSVEVQITVGELRVVGEQRRDAVFDVVRTAPSKPLLSRIPVRVEEDENRLSVVAVQTDGGTDAALRTNVTLRLPHDATVKSARVMEGRISIASFRGLITADIRRGPIEARDVSGTVRLETGIGDITATNMRLTENGLLRLRAFNGNVRLALAERPTDARVMALALNGSIQSDITLNMRDSWGPRWGEATLGKGEPVISIDVVTGKIAITSK